MHRTAQLQTQETILVLFIVVVLIIIGMAFFLRYQRETIEQERQAYERGLFQDFATALPENALLKCSRFSKNVDCIDSLKILAAATNPTLLEPLYGFKNITISQVYPPAPPGRCDRSNLLNCGHWQLYTQRPKNVRTTSRAITPVSLYRPEHDQYVLGLLIIEAYNL